MNAAVGHAWTVAWLATGGLTATGRQRPVPRGCRLLHCPSDHATPNPAPSLLCCLHVNPYPYYIPPQDLHAADPPLPLPPSFPVTSAVAEERRGEFCECYYSSQPRKKIVPQKLLRVWLDNGQVRGVRPEVRE
ncbi:hypothetical protein GW17_00044975 [Ensete ventricosum]|nr:hypothetical protein GW17_00044975 [Ensete ventricosum]RZS22586.1 hypothetical protein BHM03_00055385 [Ensete ventricosum]